MSSKPNYSVGYGKPPAEHQWKPGQSGNPGGQKKKPKPKNFQQAVVGALAAEQTVMIGGKQTTAPTYDVLAKVLVKSTLHAKGAQLVSLLNWLEKVGAFEKLAWELEDTEPYEDTFTEEDRRLLEKVHSAILADDLESST